MLQHESRANEGIKGRTGSKINAANNEHHDEVENKTPHGHFKHWVNFTQPLTSDDGSVSSQ
jgi:hypothetical protein